MPPHPGSKPSCKHRSCPSWGQKAGIFHRRGGSADARCAYAAAAPSNPVTLAPPPPHYLAPQGFQVILVTTPTGSQHHLGLNAAPRSTRMGLGACLHL